MKRVILGAALLLAVACQSNNNPVVSVFVAAPANITQGQSSQLIFASPGAQLTIDHGIGDVSTLNSVTVTPSATTTYTLIAVKNGKATTAQATVTVNASPAAGFSVVPVGGATLVAGVSARFSISALNAAGAVNPNYSGTVHFTSDDPGAALPADVTFGNGDNGVETVTATFHLAGNRVLLAADTGAPKVQGLARLVVTAGPAQTITIGGLPATARTGDRLTASVVVRDAFGNPAAGYTGTVHFTSSDSAAQLPPDTTFAAADNGQRNLTVVFATQGTQTLRATDVARQLNATAQVTLSASALVYTNPPAGGRVRLLLNGANSTQTTVQLDLVANTSTSSYDPTMEGPPAAYGGAYAVGMNLPADPAKVAAGTPLLTPGNVLNLGSAPQAIGAALPTSGPTAGVLFTGISQKAAGAGAVATDAPVSPTQVFYSIRLSLAPNAVVGTVFDGANLPAAFRAGVRNRAGIEIIAAQDFAIGKLEVR